MRERREREMGTKDQQREIKREKEKKGCEETACEEKIKRRMEQTINDIKGGKEQNKNKNKNNNIICIKKGAMEGGVNV